MVARCPQHGLHGQRSACHTCGGPVEQVEMVRLADVLEVVDRLAETAGTLAALCASSGLARIAAAGTRSP